MRKKLYDDHCCHFYDLKSIHLGLGFFFFFFSVTSKRENVLKVLAIQIDGKTKQEKH
jgi:hypothetical protein